MLRCTISGLIPLMQSECYAGYAESFYAAKANEFQNIMAHGSYYLLRELPVPLAQRLLEPELPKLLAAQKKSGMWKVKDTERITYDILAALVHVGLLDGAHPEATLKYNPSAYLAPKGDFYALLIKDRILQAPAEGDAAARAALIADIVGRQEADGSWEGTVVGTVLYLNQLLDLGLAREDPVITCGVDFLFANLQADLQGIHTSEPYSLLTHNVFTTLSRNREFESARRLKPEWLPRSLCFRTMAIIPNTVCLRLLIRLGLEGDERVARALDSLYALYSEHGGLCASNIKEPYI